MKIKELNEEFINKLALLHSRDGSLKEEAKLRNEYQVKFLEAEDTEFESEMSTFEKICLVAGLKEPIHVHA